MNETRAELPRMPRPGGIRLGLGVRAMGLRPELVLALLIVSNLCIERGITAVVTHILDGTHMRNSLHYSGAGADLTVEPASDQVWLAIELREYLGDEYDVIDEETHIHVEYQPHHGAVT